MILQLLRFPLMEDVFAKKILEKINSSAAETSALQIPGNYPYKKTGGVGLVPKADNKCTNCKLCAENCPAQAISEENIKVADSKKCISCMRCVVKCPQSARKVNAAMVSAFYCPYTCPQRLIVKLTVE